MTVIVSSKCDSAKYIFVDGDNIFISNYLHSCTKFDNSSEVLTEYLRKARFKFPEYGFVGVRVPDQLLGLKPEGIYHDTR